MLKYCSSCGTKVKADQMIVDADENYCHGCWQESHPGQAPPSVDAPPAIPVRASSRRTRQATESGAQRPAGRRLNWNVALPVAAVLAGLVLALILTRTLGGGSKPEEPQATAAGPVRLPDAPKQDPPKQDPPKQQNPPKQVTVPQRLIGNKNSMKLHTADCRFGKKTSARNRVDFDAPDAARGQGYKWCRNCGPRR